MKVELALGRVKKSENELQLYGFSSTYRNGRQYFKGFRTIRTLGKEDQELLHTDCLQL